MIVPLQWAVVPPCPGPERTRRLIHDLTLAPIHQHALVLTQTFVLSQVRVTPCYTCNALTRSHDVDHLFLSLHGSSDIRVENIVDESLVEDFRETILPMWPHGVSIEGYQSHQWRTQFTGNPWTSSGTEAIMWVCK